MTTPGDNASGGNDPKPPPLSDDAAEAARLGLKLEVYQQLKRRSRTGDVAADLQAMTATAVNRGEKVGDDIAQEDAEYNSMWRQGGIFKRRNAAPGFIATALRTPGEVAKGILFLLAFFLQLAGFGVWLSNHKKVELGALWFFILGALVVTSYIIAAFVWRMMGEKLRDIFRWVVRFWPITFPFILFVVISVLRWLFGAPVKP